jgi:capsular polysaccharide export protein
MLPATDLDLRYPDMPGVLYTLGISVVKWPDLRRCFPGRKLVRLHQTHVLPADAWVVAWGLTPLPADLPSTITVLRLEDGFLRSVGLGVDLVRPLSWVIDRQGIHFDATRSSDLETLLATRTFDVALRRRAANLRERIVAEHVTKYNVGSETWQRPRGISRVILVPGQVPTDAAMSFATLRPATNMALLSAVRKANPDAYVVYKVHPDIIARMRLQQESVTDAQDLCDEVIGDVDMAELLAMVDEVHVMTSLTGFEALLRDRPVTCYGRPFYSGWGLTRDLDPPTERRRRRLTLDELVASALIDYPLYLNRNGTGLVTPEQALDTLLVQRRSRHVGGEWWKEPYRMVLRRLVGVR